MIRQRAVEYWKRVTADAPQGPWHFEPERGALSAGGGERLGEVASAQAGEFIAAAREAMPALLAEVEHLVALLREVGQPRERLCPDCGPLDALGHKKRCRIAPYLR